MYTTHKSVRLHTKRDLFKEKNQSNCICIFYIFFPECAHATKFLRPAFRHSLTLSHFIDLDRISRSILNKKKMKETK